MQARHSILMKPPVSNTHYPVIQICPFHHANLFIPDLYIPHTPAAATPVHGADVFRSGPYMKMVKFRQILDHHA